MANDTKKPFVGKFLTGRNLTAKIIGNQSVITYGQTFCELHTLLHSFYGFPGACCKVTILIGQVEGWTFVGLFDCIISHFEQN